MLLNQYLVASDQDNTESSARGRVTAQKAKSGLLFLIYEVRWYT